MENSCLGNGSHSLLFVRGCCWQLCEKGPECLIVNRKKIHTRRAGNTGQSEMLRSRKLSTKWAFHITKACSLGITSELVRNAESWAMPQTCWNGTCMACTHPILKFQGLQTPMVSRDGLIGVGPVVTGMGQKLDCGLTEPSNSQESGMHSSDNSEQTNEPGFPRPLAMPTHK